jgi:hypothetical protein
MILFARSGRDCRQVQGIIGVRACVPDFCQEHRPSELSRVRWPCQGETSSYIKIFRCFFNSYETGIGGAPLYNEGGYRRIDTDSDRSKITMLESNVIFLEHLIVGYCFLAGLGLTVAFVALFVQRR